MSRNGRRRKRAKNNAHKEKIEGNLRHRLQLVRAFGLKQKNNEWGAADQPRKDTMPGPEKRKDQLSNKHRQQCQI